MCRRSVPKWYYLVLIVPKFHFISLSEQPIQSFTFSGQTWPFVSFIPVVVIVCMFKELDKLGNIAAKLILFLSTDCFLYG